jgi:hypothetical protein
LQSRSQRLGRGRAFALAPAIKQAGIYAKLIAAVHEGNQINAAYTNGIN